MAVPKGAGTTRLKTELEQTIEEEGLQEFARVYTDGSLAEDRVGCLVICDPEEIKIRLAEQTCIFNAAAQAIIEDAVQQSSLYEILYQSPRFLIIVAH
jgi:hypothetical protein